MKEKFLECGRIVNTHGIKGAVRTESWCDSPETLASLSKIYFKRGAVYEPCKIIHASLQKHMVLLTLEGIDDIDKAIAQKDTVIYAAREDIAREPGAVFIADLIGLPVIDAESAHLYGKVKDVINKGASDIYVIDTGKGEALLPAVAEFVKKVDLEKGIFITPIEGIFE